MKTITTGHVPGTLQTVAVEDDATVRNVLEAAELSADGLEVRVNGSAATLDTSVPDGAKVYLVKKVKGN
jgi:sulfur carrier protein ThiS